MDKNKMYQKLYAAVQKAYQQESNQTAGPPTKAGPGAMAPSLFLKSHFARNIFLEIRFCVILQGIQNFFGSGSPKISFGGLGRAQRKRGISCGI